MICGNEKAGTPVTTGDMMHVHGAFGTHTDYTVRLTVRLIDPVDGAMLPDALDRTQRRYPYFSVRLLAGERSYYYVQNDAPIALLHTDARARLNAAESNGHVWAVCWNDDRIHLEFFHGITDGTGMYRVLATLLYYYCYARYGVTDHSGILTLEDPILPEETRDPQDTITMPEVSVPPAAPFLPAFTAETDGGLTPSAPTVWDIELPEAPFIRFTSANDASPGTMVSLLLAHAMDEAFPEREKDIISAYVINARPMLCAEMTHHNCLGMAVFRFDDRIKMMPFDRQCTVYRGMTFLQSDADRVRRDMAVGAIATRETAEAAATIEQKRSVFAQAFNAGEGYLSYLVSYTGKWKHPSVGAYIREFWTHPSNTFSLMAELGAVNGKIFVSLQQRFREDTIREGFLRQLERHGVPYTLRHVNDSDVAHLAEP